MARRAATAAPAVAPGTAATATTTAAATTVVFADVSATVAATAATGKLNTQAAAIKVVAVATVDGLIRIAVVWESDVATCKR